MEQPAAKRRKFDQSSLYECRGQHYMQARKGSGVSGNVSFEEIAAYLEQASLVCYDDTEIPFASIEDFVASVRQVSSGPTSSFQWPSASFSFQRCLTVCLCRAEDLCRKLCAFS